MLKNILMKIFGRNDHLCNFNKLQSCGANVEYDRSTQLIFPERIKLGNYIYLGPNCYLNGRGGLSIHNHVILAPQIVILTSMHNYRDADLLPYDRVELLSPVTIEQCVWVGMRAMILPGVTIGEGSIVGAGAVVTRSCNPGTILGGNPAKEIGQRNMEHYKDCLKEERFYLQQKNRLNFCKNERFV